MGGHKVAPNPALVDTYPDVYLTTGLVAENHAREAGVCREEQDAFALAAISARSPPSTPAASPTRSCRSIRAPSRSRRTPASRCWPSTKVRGATRRSRRSPGCGRRFTSTARSPPATRRRRATAPPPCSSCRATRARELGLEPLARFVAFATAGVEPERFGIGPVPAIRKVLKLAGLTLDQIDLVELNEAFAAQVLACLRELPIDPERLNVNGGAIALGHPLGCTGARLTTTLLYEMRRRSARYGLVTMCVGGGMGAAGIFERSVDVKRSTRSECQRLARACAGGRDDPQRARVADPRAMR